MAKYLFIGGGNMAQAIIAGMYNQQIYVVEKNINLHTKIKANQIYEDIYQANLNDMDCIILAVKPQDSCDVLQSMAKILHNKTAIILSIMAGISISFIQKYITNLCIRAMPNTPILIQKGTTAIYGQNIHLYKILIENIFANSSKIYYLDDEQQMHTVTAMSGSGPAYIFYILDYLTKAGIELGLNHELAKQLICSTCIGAGEMAMRSTDNLEILQHKVMSKGGTTEAAVNYFNSNNLPQILAQAINQAYKRSIELETLINENLN